MLRIKAILLAAGNSSRFGVDKLLYPVQHKPLAYYSASHLKKIMPDMVAVHAAEQNQRQALFQELGIKTLCCHEKNAAMGLSLALAIQQYSHYDAWLICLADMPLIKTTTIEKVKQKMLTGADICAAFYQNQRGFPVGFSNKFLPELLQLNADIGARKILKKHSDQLVKIKTDDPGCLIDIDRKSDIKRYQLETALSKLEP